MADTTSPTTPSAVATKEFITKQPTVKTPTPLDRTASASTKQREFYTKSAVLKNPYAIQTFAGRAGLGADVQRINASKGEKPDVIFSGGWLSDTFDVLNALQYGVTGLLTGKTFAEGVNTRASFTKTPELQNKGLPGLLTGIALDIASDPLTYVAPYSVLKRIPYIDKAIKGTKDVVGATRLGQDLGKKFIYRFGQDPVYVAMDERRIASTASNIENAINLVRPLTKLDPTVRRAMLAKNEAGQVIRRTPQELQQILTPQQYQNVTAAWGEIDNLGKQLVDLKILDKGIYEKNVGEYIRNLYTKYEAPKAGEKFLKGIYPAKPNRLDLAFTKARKDMPEEVRKALGQIDEAGYPTADTLLRLTKAVEDGKFYKAVAEKFGQKDAAEGLSKLPVTPRLGALSGLHVPQPIFDAINEEVKTASGFQKAMRPIVAGFKYGKVILNPATHARNIMSNFLLNHFEGMNPLDPRAMKAYAVGGKQAFAKSGKWYDEAKKVGLGMDTYAANEIRSFLEMPEVAGQGKKAKQYISKIADAYQREEEWAKLSQYIFQRTTKGLPPEEAWRVAERATFNYAQVTPFIRTMRESIFGFPFLTFTAKATPQVAKTVATHPTRISNIGKIRQGIENQANLKETAQERAVEPDWIRNAFYMKLPWKDSLGRSAYLDLTYILPFGDLLSGGVINQNISRESGLPENPVRGALRNSPFFNLIAELASNQDFYGNKIVRESDTTYNQGADLLRHMALTYLPPLSGEIIPGGIQASGERRKAGAERVMQNKAKQNTIEGGGAQTRTGMEELLRQVGVKIDPMDLKTQKSYSENERLKAIQTLLQERGIIAQYSIPFTPHR